MTTIKHISFVALASLTLASCTPHLTQQQCHSMNWRQMGYADGSQGRVQRNLQSMVTDCAKFNITINSQGYRKGWRAGTREFCQPSVAFKMGTEGKTYNDICPAHLAAAFNHAWHRGLRKYCIPSTGYNLGRSGHLFPNFCAPARAVAFRNAYDRGYRVYQNIQNIQSDINSVNARMTEAQIRVRRKNQDIYHSLRHKKMPGEKHNHYQTHERIRQDKQDVHQLNNQLDQMRDHRDNLQRQLNHENGRG